MTYRIHLTGIVQGVGFRPMVFTLANRLGVMGTVSNSSAGVNIVFNASNEEAAGNFYRAVLQSAPRQSRITHHQMDELGEAYSFRDFSIIESRGGEGPTVMISPDFALCESCRRELKDPENRRYRYPFITCTQCGPRYSIVRRLPYDRIFTTMRRFDPCENCGTEYANPADRRFYSQTNSCDECGIKMSLLLPEHVVSGNRPILLSLVNMLREGKTVAVKGIGGYLLLCDATQASAIIRLRDRKHRPTKPFALMYPNAASLKEDVVMSEGAWKAIQGSAAPIVLAPFKGDHTSGIQISLIAPGLHTLGVMLPYAPLLELITSDFEKPLIATSANISNSPIIYDDHEAMNSLFSVADAILVHNRGIVIPQDDSVVRFTHQDRQIIIRRSRGLAPDYFASFPFPSRQVVAMGAQLKSTVTLLHKSNIYVSQYIGDLESADTEKNYQAVLQHLMGITGARPEIILTDEHPDYASTGFGERLANLFHVPVHKVQHHRAHFTAVLAENDLLETEERILGVIWDGTGLGDDRQSWGGEFFTWDGHQMERTAHLSYFPLLLGDKMAREPRLSALSVAGLAHRDLLASRFTAQELKLYAAMMRTEDMKTSSMGRLFDAVASLCGLCNKTSYEGEAALLLEEAATVFMGENPGYFNAYPIQGVGDDIDTQAIAGEIISDLQSGSPPEKVAASFHCTLVNMVRKVARANQITAVAFSGGVFQNALLVGMLEEHLGEDYQIYFHRQLSPNDECISFGQLAYWKMFQGQTDDLTDLASSRNEATMVYGQ